MVVSLQNLALFCCMCHVLETLLSGLYYIPQEFFIRKPQRWFHPAPPRTAPFRNATVSLHPELLSLCRLLYMQMFLWHTLHWLKASVCSWPPICDLVSRITWEKYEKFKSSIFRATPPPAVQTVKVKHQSKKMWWCKAGNTSGKCRCSGTGN